MDKKDLSGFDNLVAKSSHALTLQSKSLVTRGLRDLESANRELAEAAYHVGQEREGAGDFVEAAVHYRRAAELGYFGAMLSLAEMYETGRGVEHDVRKATHWWQRAGKCGGGADVFAAFTGELPNYRTDLFKRLDETFPEQEAVEAKETLASICARVEREQLSGNPKGFVFASAELLSYVMSVEGRLAELTESDEVRRKGQESARETIEKHAAELKNQIKRYKGIFRD